MQARHSVAMLLLFTLAGCAGETGPAKEEVVPVSGTLTYQGKPLPYFAITFLPSDGRRAAVGTTDELGNFTMGTNDLGDGVPPGTNKVAVTFAGPPSDAPPGQESVIDDPAQMPKPAVAIPKKYHNPETSGLTVEVPPDGLVGYALELE